MKTWIGAAFGCLLIVSCSGTKPPEVTPEMAHTRKGAEKLQSGRILYAYRCIECHTLPAIASHTKSEWPHLIDAMAHRASLKPAEREAVVAYVLAARADDSQ